MMRCSSLNILQRISRNICFKTSTSRCYGVARRCLSQQAIQTKGVRASNEQFLEVTWDDGKADKYPYVYLRENCRCSKCFKEVYNSRIIFSPTSIDLNLKPKSADFNSGGELKVEWEDGHSSAYTSEFLKQLRYKKPGEELPSGILRKGIELWGSELGEEGNLPLFDFEKVINDDDELYKWLVTLLTTTGVAKIVNAPTKIGQLEKLGKRIGYLAATFYGNTEYQIKAYAGEKAKEVGYSSDELPIHTDYTFCSNSPAVGLFHCVEQTSSEGGDNILVDAFHAAKMLHEEDPEGFRLLSETPVRFNNRTVTQVGSYHNIVFRNLISLDREKKLSCVVYSDEFRDAHMPQPPDVMSVFYRAYFRLSHLLYDKRTSFSSKLQSGEIFTLNNHRVLHGRKAYSDTEENVRHLQLGYLDWDGVHAKLRVLAKEKGVECPID